MGITRTCTTPGTGVVRGRILMNLVPGLGFGGTVGQLLEAIKDTIA